MGFFSSLIDMRKKMPKICSPTIPTKWSYIHYTIYTITYHNKIFIYENDQIFKISESIFNYFLKVKTIFERVFQETPWVLKNVFFLGKSPKIQKKNFLIQKKPF